MPLIVLGSPKGGTGKTTITAGVAAVLAESGRRTICIDLDPQNALRLNLGVPLNEGAGIGPVLANPYATQPLSSFLRWTSWGIGLVPFGQTDAPTALAIAATLAARPQPLHRLLEDFLADPALTILVDTPPGPSTALTAVLPYADLLACVLLSDAISISLIPSIESGRAFGPGTQRGVEGGRLCYVLNQADQQSRLSRASGNAARPYLGRRLLGEIRRDELVAEAAATQCPVPFFAPNSPAAADIRHVTGNIAALLGLPAGRA